MSAESAFAECREALSGSTLLLMSFAALAVVAGAVLGQADVTLYHHYGTLLLHGHGGHRLPVEYPALAAAVFALPIFLPISYKIAFDLLMLSVCVIFILVAQRLGLDRGWRDRFALYLFLGTFTVIFARYDLLPALAALVAVVQARKGSWRSAWVAATIGAALKIFPILLLPGFFLAEWRDKGRLPWRRVVALGSIGLAFAGIQNALVPSSVISPLRYEFRRGFELSSIPGSLTLLIDPLHLHWTYAFKTWEVVGYGTPYIGLFLAAAAIFGLAAVWRLGWHRRLDVAGMSLSVLTIAVLTDRSFAPQYLVWLAPLWALWPLRRAWIATAALTTLTYPVAWILGEVYTRSFLPAMVFATARNGILIVGTLLWLKEHLLEKAEPPLTFDEPVTLIGFARRETPGPRLVAGGEVKEVVGGLPAGNRLILGGDPFVLDVR